MENRKNKKILIARCSECQKEFGISWVRGQKSFSQKNNLEYWTEKISDQGKKICNDCLKSLKENKRESHYWQFASKKKILYNSYLTLGRFE